MIEVSNVLPVPSLRDIDTAIKWALANDAAMQCVCCASKQLTVPKCFANTLLLEKKVAAWPIGDSAITAGSMFRDMQQQQQAYV